MRVTQGLICPIICLLLLRKMGVDLEHRKSFSAVIDQKIQPSNLSQQSDKKRLRRAPHFLREDTSQFWHDEELGGLSCTFCRNYLCGNSI